MKQIRTAELDALSEILEKGGVADNFVRFGGDTPYPSPAIADRLDKRGLIRLDRPVVGNPRLTLTKEGEALARERYRELHGEPPYWWQ